MSKLTDKKRNALVENANWLLEVKKNHPDLIGYSQQRPELDLMKKSDLENWFHQGKKIETDCAGMIQLLFFISGCDDPTGNNFNGYGNSEAMWNNCKPHFNEISKLGLGSLVTYGLRGDVHVAMVMDKTNDPYVFSHGSSEGPKKVLLHDEDNAHAGQTRTFLSVGDEG